MEHSFQTNLQSVRLHVDLEPAQYGAAAFTQGEDVHIQPRYYRPNSAAGHQLLGHELAHVIQQRAGRVPLATGQTINSDPALEREADGLASLAARGELAVSPGHAGFSTATGSPATAPGPVPIQCALINDPLGGLFLVDDRDPASTQHFVPRPLGAANEYRDQHGYDYRYLANEELLVLGGAAHQYWDSENQVQLRKHIDGVKHIYASTGSDVNNHANRRYYDAHHLYVQPPSNRVRWVDTVGHFVDGYGRVLTDDGARVQKHYAVTKDANLNYILPYKLRAGFMGGLPNLFGGNMDAGDAGPATAVGREIDEESDWHYEINGGVNPVSAQNDGGNRYHFHTAQVTRRGGLARMAARPAHPPAAEMAGTFEMRASSFAINGGTTDQDIRDAILAKFGTATGTDMTHPYFTTVQHGQHETPFEQFDASHAIAALVANVRHDHGEYHQGLADERAGNLAALAPSDEYTAARLLYVQALADARAGNAAARGQEPAYMEAYNEYGQGLLDAQNGNAAVAGHAANEAAHADYALGLQDAQAGNMAMHPHIAYRSAFDDYNQGLQDAQNGIDPTNFREAYMAAQNEYGEGRHDGENGNDAASDTAAYEAGYNDA